MRVCVVGGGGLVLMTFLVLTFWADTLSSYIVCLARQNHGFTPERPDIIVN